MKKFTFLQRLRNKIRIDGELDLEISENARIVNCFIHCRGKNNTLVIEEGSVLRHTHLEILGNNSSIVIGKNCGIGHNSYLSAKEGRTLLVHDECSFSRNVKIMTSDGHPIFQEDRMMNYAKDITIGKRVWIADNVTVLKGVEVGEDSVLGINSTVTKSVPAKSIAVGNPAQVVKENIRWED